MKRNFSILMVCLIALVFATGCEDQKTTQGDLVVRFACDKFSMHERSLLPEAEAMEIESYHIYGEGPNDETVDMAAYTSEVTLGQLSMGTWTLNAQALNKDGAILAQGATTTMLSKTTSTATIHLTDLVGEGSLSVGFTWNTDQVSDDVRLALLLTDQNGEILSIEDPVVDKLHGSATFSTTLDAGSYLLCSKLYSQEVLVSGSAEAVRIIADTTTSGSIEMLMGDRSTSFSVTVINDTMMPIAGTVSCTPSEPAAGESVTLTFTAENLQGMDENDLTICWYCEGLPVEADGFSYTSVPAAGSHRYDVIVSHDKLGSLGSTTIIVAMPII
ncbi:hypothetical protein [Sphaerochaeta sp. PS]|uniref:hypothetical protein n=1 Tax=Sphaerochaeta sp. PS TaxID=3076336 RepID=UPI0028A46434|nr:hypothetical protein [Sphaerochaeta sp. PS]MDT4762035.1 hypothetical protein [Sphaerochaeta sp. PS]